MSCDHDYCCGQFAVLAATTHGMACRMVPDFDRHDWVLYAPSHTSLEGIRWCPFCGASLTEGIPEWWLLTCACFGFGLVVGCVAGIVVRSCVG